MKSIQKMH
ncbi:hypothetical protein BpHYR1_010648 [Brachionus plicatilis]|uniref:Uncharacterized protein n=1 Tax=Brachionus plicatilis TaxID=10195 RepID=A0A3M7PAX1_BRAPC|nr:hypothetical protein BpHYR1_010648 [Brachionus plicatilis]